MFSYFITLKKIRTKCVSVYLNHGVAVLSAPLGKPLPTPAPSTGQVWLFSQAIFL